MSTIAARWSARIAAAVDAVIEGTGPVQLGPAPEESPVVEVGWGDPAVEGPFAPGGPVVVEGGTLRVLLGSPARGAVAGESVEHVRRVAQLAGAQLRTGSYAVHLAGLPGDLVCAAVDGLATGYAGEGRVVLDVGGHHVEAADRGLLNAAVAGLAALLTSAPANVLTPAVMAELARGIANRCSMSCDVRDPQAVVAEGFGGLAAVGAGARNGPYLVTLGHDRPGSGRVGLVGKGVTFDSGGLSLKTPAAMQSMRMDVGGAAAVLAVMAALPRLNVSCSVQAVLPLVENMPGPDATRPGDVVAAWNGTAIQVLDTDFEGRVILADGLALAASAEPDLLVDVATLTHAVVLALGPQISAVIGRDPAAVRQVLAAAEVAGEPMAALPWAPRYLDQVRTEDGVRNHPLTDTGRALTAALFLGEFVPPGVPWAHLDISGPAWVGDTSGEHATGFAARTLLALLDGHGASTA